MSYAADVEVKNAEAFAKLVPADAKVEKIATGMKFTEGPVWTNADGGYLVFSDIPSNELKRWDEKNGLQTYRKPSNETNGNTRDAQGRLFSCEHAGRKVVVEQKDSKVDIATDNFGGKKYNSPNDVVVQSDGTVWFTDPPYGTPKDQKREIDVQGVYCLNKLGVVHLVLKDFDMPNGLCFSPDEKKLYIADSGKPHHIRVFDVVQSRSTEAGDLWSLKDGKIFCVIDKGVPDGIRCDAEGNIWSSAEDGVQIFSLDGKLIGKILVPESPANLGFGGADGKTLFMTARTSLYRIQTSIAGATTKR